MGKNTTTGAGAKAGAKAGAQGDAGIDAGLVECNLAVLSGTCSAPAEVRVLESGTRVASLSVRAPAAATKTGPKTASKTASKSAVKHAGERATSVPVTVWDPPAWVEQLDTGDHVVVVGQVRRRFYSRPGGVGSRVDLEAASIARARDRRRIDAVLRRATESLATLDDLR